MYKLIYTVVFLLAALGASAQNMPERSEVRRGNRQYNKGNYEKSIERYERALEAAPESFRGDLQPRQRLYKAERFDKAEQTMRRAAADSLRTDGGACRSVLQPGQRPVQAAEIQGRRSKATNSRCG